MLVTLKHWKPIAITVAAAALFAAGLCAGYSSAWQKQQSQIDRLLLKSAEEKAASAEAHAAALRKEAHAARQQAARANELESALLLAEAQIARQTEDRKKAIDEAIKKDRAANPCRDGLGTHSLREYSRALGY